MAGVTRRRKIAKAEGSYHHGDLRRALLDAAISLVEKTGPSALTLRAAARLAGVSQAAPYRHFADKEALLAAVVEDGLRGLSKAMRASCKKDDDPLYRFGAIGVAYVVFAAANRSHFRVIFGTSVADKTRFPSLGEAEDETFSLLLDAIRDCQSIGVVRAGDTRELALAAWSIVHGLASLVVDGQMRRIGIEEEDAERFAQSVTQALFSGLAPRAKH